MRSSLARVLWISVCLLSCTAKPGLLPSLADDGARAEASALLLEVTPSGSRTDGRLRGRVGGDQVLEVVVRNVSQSEVLLPWEDSVTARIAFATPGAPLMGPNANMRSLEDGNLIRLAAGEQVGLSVSVPLRRSGTAQLTVTLANLHTGYWSWRVGPTGERQRIEVKPVSMWRGSLRWTEAITIDLPSTSKFRGRSPKWIAYEALARGEKSDVFSQLALATALREEERHEGGLAVMRSALAATRHEALGDLLGLFMLYAVREGWGTRALPDLLRLEADNGSALARVVLLEACSVAVNGQITASGGSSRLSETYSEVLESDLVERAKTVLAALAKSADADVREKARELLGGLGAAAADGAAHEFR